mmetsp:Transcript_27023/g.81032  ORF Transcript_27023/g.81032 Transcript_27023/m.81032 type:complete len:268 (-) Transcript_27023:55-858(-)
MDVNLKFFGRCARPNLTSSLVRHGRRRAKSDATTPCARADTRPMHADRTPRSSSSGCMMFSRACVLGTTTALKRRSMPSQVSSSAGGVQPKAARSMSGFFGRSRFSGFFSSAGCDGSTLGLSRLRFSGLGKLRRSSSCGSGLASLAARAGRAPLSEALGLAAGAALAAGGLALAGGFLAGGALDFGGAADALAAGASAALALLAAGRRAFSGVLVAGGAFLVAAGRFAGFAFLPLLGVAAFGGGGGASRREAARARRSDIMLLRQGV